MGRSSKDVDNMFFERKVSSVCDFFSLKECQNQFSNIKIHLFFSLSFSCLLHIFSTFNINSHFDNILSFQYTLKINQFRAKSCDINGWFLYFFKEFSIHRIR